MTERPFRFGVMFGAAATAREWRDKVRRVEDLGFSVALLSNHPAHQPLAPIPALAAAAAATTQLRIGTLVLDNDFTHPALLANDLATLDVVSDGRLEVGIGAGWLAADYTALGITFDRPGVRLARLDEALTLMKRLWAAEMVSHDGEHYRVEGLAGVPRPVQQPHPPLLIGGGGPRLLALAARHADIVGLAPNMRSGQLGADSASTSTPAATDEKIAIVRDVAGERFREIEIQANVTFVRTTDDVEGQSAKVAKVYGLPASEAHGIVHALFGTPSHMVEQLIARRERYGVTYLTAPEAFVDDLAPVVAKLAGS